MTLPLELVRGTDEPKVLGETRNVSSAGVFFRIGEKVHVGQGIEYFLTFPKAPGATTSVRVRCLGTVIREEDSCFAATLERYEFIRADAPAAAAASASGSNRRSESISLTPSGAASISAS